MAFAVSYNSDMKRYMYEVCMKNRISGQLLFKTGYKFSNKKKALKAATSIRDLVVAQKDYGVLHHHVIKCIKRARLESLGNYMWELSDTEEIMMGNGRTFVPLEG